MRMFVNRLYFGPSMMVKSRPPSLEKIISPLVVLRILEGQKELSHPLTERVEVGRTKGMGV